MKKILIVPIIVLYSCNNTTSKPETTPQAEQQKDAVVKPVEKKEPEAAPSGKDTLRITQNAVVLYDASDVEIKEMQKGGDENFGESLSDNLHYMDEARTEALKQKINVIRTSDDLIIFQKKDGSHQIWKRGRNYEGWGAIAYTEETGPNKIEITNARDEFKKYFRAK